MPFLYARWTIITQTTADLAWDILHRAPAIWNMHYAIQAHLGNFGPLNSTFTKISSDEKVIVHKYYLIAAVFSLAS